MNYWRDKSNLVELPLDGDENSESTGGAFESIMFKKKSTQAKDGANPGAIESQSLECRDDVARRTNASADSKVAWKEIEKSKVSYAKSHSQEAANAGNADVLPQTHEEKLIEANVNDEHLKELLEYINNENSIKFEEVIEKSQIDLNQMTSDGRLLLHEAVLQDRIGFVKILLKYGASALATDRNGELALGLAIEHDRMEIGKLLLQRNVNEQLHTSRNHQGEPLSEWINKDAEKRHWLDLVPQKKCRPGFVGNLYHLNILALLSLRYYKNERFAEFKLAMEVDEFGKFDDIVFECRGLKSLIQVKHKSNNKISIHEILPRGREKVHFGLKMYYESFLELHDKGLRDFVELIVLTNTTLSIDCEPYFETDSLPEDHILNLDRNSIKFYKIRKNEVIQHRSMRGIDEEKFTMFCQKFRLALNFPDEEATQKLIKTEIGELFELRDSEVPDSLFMQRLQNWFKEKVSKPLTASMIRDLYEVIDENITTMQAIGFHKFYCDNLPRIAFASHNDKLQYSIQNLNGKVLIIRTPCVQLTSKRVSDHLRAVFKNEDDFLMILLKNLIRKDSKQSNVIAKAIKSKNSFKVLVVACPSNGPGDIYSEFLAVLNDSKKKIIFIRYAGALQTNYSDMIELHFPKSKGTLDNPLFAHFTVASQQQFMEKEILFEGRNVRIRDVLSFQLIDEVFDPQTLYESIAPESEIKIQNHWSFDSSSQYIPRRLEEVGAGFVFEEQEFYTSNYRRNIVICGNPGVGKSSLLARIQEKMNQIGNRFWAIKLNLNDFAHDASKENHFSRIDFMEHESDKAIEFLCKMVAPSNGELSLSQKLTRQLLAFCLKHNLRVNELLPKIILLFDGFDEIAPKYTEPVLCLFRSLNLANMEQMWISTRNHEIETVAKIFKSIKYDATITLSAEQIIPAKEITKLTENHKPLKIIFQEKETDSDTRTVNEFKVFETPKNEVNDVPIIRSIIAKIIHANSKLNVDGEKNVFTSSFHLYELDSSKRFLELLNTILSTESDSPFEEINFSHSCTELKHKEPSSSILEVKFNSIYLQISVDLNESNLKFIATVKNFEVFNLLNPNQSEQCDFLLNYYESHKNEIPDEIRDGKIVNIIILCKIIDDNYIRNSQAKGNERLRNLLEIARRTFIGHIPSVVVQSLNSFLATPIHLQMLAELAVKGNLEFSSEFRLHRIYEDLISLKENIYLDEKQRQGSNADESRRACVEKARYFHKMMARAELLFEENAEFQESLSKNHHFLYKFGLTCYTSGKLRFVHRSFAEWFLALDTWENIRKEETQRLFIELILPRFALVTQFLDSKLSEQQSSTFQGLRISVSYIPFYQKSTWNKNFSLVTVCKNGSFNILRFLFKTLENCYPLFVGARSEKTFIETLIKKRPSEIFKLFSDLTNLNRESLNYIIEILEDQWKQLYFYEKQRFIENIRPTHFDWKTLLLEEDLTGHSIYFNNINNQEKIEYFFTKFKTEFDRETFRKFVLRTNFAGETFLFKRWLRFKDYSTLCNLVKILPVDILTQLIETCSFYGKTIFHHLRERASYNKLFGSLCNLMEFSEDFLMITIFDNFFFKKQSLDAVLQRFEEFFRDCDQSQKLDEQWHRIREIIQRNRNDFEVNLVKLNEALMRQSLEEVELILRNSKEYIRELVLACKYKKKFALRNAEIILKIAEHLEPHRVIYQHWILRLPFMLIERNCYTTFERIFPRVREVLLTIEIPSFYCFFIKYFHLTVRSNRQMILEVLLDFLETTETSRKEDLLLYKDLAILTYIQSKNPHQSCDFNLLKWLLNDISNFQDATLVKVLMFCADHYFALPIDESTCRDKMFRWLETTDSVTRKQMNKIFFGLLFCNFSDILQELAYWINNKVNELPFRLIDVVHFDVLEPAKHGMPLSKILDSFEALNLRSEIRNFLLVEDSDRNAFLHKLQDFHEITKFIPIAVQEISWIFLESKNRYNQTFLTQHNSKEYFTDILQLLKDHGMEATALEGFILSEILGAAEKQPNFTKTIDFCLENFRSVFEDLFSENSHSIFYSIMNNTKSYEILIHLDTECGAKCKESLFDFISLQLSIDNCRKYFFLLKFVFEKYLEQNTKYAPLFASFERDSLEFLYAVAQEMTRKRWKNYFIFPPNNNFTDVLRKFFKVKSLSSFYRWNKLYLQDRAFERGVGLKVLEITPKTHLKKLLCDSDSNIPLGYLQKEENLKGLLEFLMKNIEHVGGTEFLEKLNINTEGDIEEQLKMRLENVMNEKQIE